jgi:outer membrane protein assembly factor BamB
LAAPPLIAHVDETNTLILVAGTDGSVRCFDGPTGREVWTRKLSSSIEAQPAYWESENSVLVGAANGDAALIDLWTGEVRATWKVAGSIKVQPVPALEADPKRAFVRADGIWVLYLFPR